MTTWTTRKGLEDRVLSVVPVSSLASGKPTAECLEGKKNTDDGWLLQLDGGEYNDVKQSAQIEMVCDDKATEASPQAAEPGHQS